MNTHCEKTRLGRRIAAMALSLLLIVSLLPVVAFAENDGAASAAGAAGAAASSSSSADDRFASIIEPGVPSGYSDDIANPYGKPIGEKFLLSEQNELLLYYSFDTNKNTKNQHANWFDTFNQGSSPSLTESNTGFKDSGTYDNTQAYNYVQAIGFDPNGTGRKDHVAYLGYQRTGDKNDKGYYVLWVVNTKDGTQSDVLRVQSAPGASCNWLDDKNADLYAGSNFFNIVAGDFDGHGGDDLVISITDDSNYGLSQIRYENGGFTQITQGEKGLLHSRYNDYHSASGTSWANEAKNKLSCDLTVGDFNGDGIDDLAVISYPNYGHEINDTSNMRDLDFGMPQLSISYGSSEGVNFVQTAAASTYVSTPYEEGSDEYAGMLCPSVAAGDINNDGVDEIVAAGYKSQVYSNGGKGSYRVIALNGAPLEGLFYASFNALGNALSNIEYKQLSTNAWTQNHSGCTDPVGAKIAIETASIDGRANPDRIFISGTVYRCGPDSNKLFTEENTAGFSPETLDYFKSSDSSAGRKLTGKSYLAAVAVGNFTNGKEAYEQIAYVTGLQSSDSTHDYSFSVHIATGKDYTDGVATGFQLDTGSYIFSNQQFGLDKRTNCIIASIDRDDDGIVASYTGAGYSWSDPQVRAILQASPYFAELNDEENGAAYLYDSPETTYSTTTVYSFETSKSNSVSFGAGFAGELSGTVVSGNLEAGYALDWTKTFTESIDEEVSNSFSAGAYDTVVLCRTPVFMYNYDVTYLDDNGNLTSDVYQMAFPKAPVLNQLSTERYNEFVDYYNNLVKTASEEKGVDASEYQQSLLEKLGDGLFLGQEGNPYGYYLDNLSSGLNPAPTQYGDLVSLTTNAGANSIEYSYTKSTGQSVEKAHGFTFDLTIMGGFSVGGIGAKAGGYVSLQYMKGHSTSTTKGEGTTIGGTVMGLDGKAMEADGLNPDAWGFNWRLGTWNSNLKDDSMDKSGYVPIIGYVLSSVASPSAPVENLDAVFSRDEATSDLVFDVSWECGDVAGSGRPATAGYRIYLYDIAQGKYLLLDTIDDPQTTTYRYQDAFDGREYYAFMVTSYSNATTTAPSRESAPRYTTHYMSTTDATIVKIEKSGTDGLNDIYTIYLADGTTQTFTVTNGNGISSITLVSSDAETLVDTYQITFTDGSTTTFTVKNGAAGEKGDTGASGSDGVGIDRIAKLRSIGYTDIYAVYLTDGTFYTFTVTNGQDGKNGTNGTNDSNGTNGANGVSVTGKSGTNGASGQQGSNGLTGASGASASSQDSENEGASAALASANEVNSRDSATSVDAETAATIKAMQEQLDTLQGQVNDMQSHHVICYIALVLSIISLIWNAVRTVQEIRNKQAKETHQE